MTIFAKITVRRARMWHVLLSLPSLAAILVNLAHQNDCVACDSNRGRLSLDASWMVLWVAASETLSIPCVKDKGDLIAHFPLEVVKFLDILVHFPNNSGARP